jgi:hypothetical protein
MKLWGDFVVLSRDDDGNEEWRFHSCCRCGRELSLPASIERGIGSECFGRMTPSQIVKLTTAARAMDAQKFRSEERWAEFERLKRDGPRPDGSTSSEGL